MPGTAPSASAASRAIPKSVTIARPSRASRMLPGFTSRWTIPRTWATPSARATSRPIRAASVAAQAPAPAQTSGEVLALDQLHDQERLAVVRAGLQAGDDVGVAQHGRGQRLPPEAHRDVAVLDRLAPQELDRHGPVELRVQRAMDGGHAAEADDLAEAVAAVDQPADVRGGVRGLVRLGHRGDDSRGAENERSLRGRRLVEPTMQVERGRPPDAGARRRTSCR